MTKKEDRFNKVYGSDGEPGPFCDLEYLEDNQYFDEHILPDVFLPDADNFSLVLKVTNLLRKEVTSQIMIHLVQ